MINLESFNPIVSRIEETTEKFIHCLSSELQIVEYIRAAVDFFTGQTGSLDTIGSFLSDAENGKICIFHVKGGFLASNTLETIICCTKNAQNELFTITLTDLLSRVYDG